MGPQLESTVLVEEKPMDGNEQTPFDPDDPPRMETTEQHHGFEQVTSPTQMLTSQPSYQPLETVSEVRSATTAVAHDKQAGTPPESPNAAFVH